MTRASPISAPASASPLGIPPVSAKVALDDVGRGRVEGRAVGEDGRDAVAVGRGEVEDAFEVFEAFILRGGTPVRVGFILWTQVNEIKSVILNLTYVLPEFRGSGISKAMLEAFEEFILAREESRNINRLCSYINKNNTRMLALAESTGRKIDSLYTTRVIR
jgi:GNAT superfamily N-acetyltransferase